MEEEGFRIRLPRGREVFGIVQQRLGGSRLSVLCMDGKKRVCRIPGRMKRYLWVRENDLVLVEPWEIGGDEKGDVVFKYRKHQHAYLQKKGYLKAFAEFEEF